MQNLWNSSEFRTFFLTKKTHTNRMPNYTMQYCAEIVSQTIFHRCVDIILLVVLYTICIVCGILCGKILHDLMYSYNKKYQLKQKQMIGHLHRGIVVQLKGVHSKFKHYNNKKNNCWHFNRIFTGYFTRTTATTRTMWNTTSIMMSGKLTIWWNKK